MHATEPGQVFHFPVAKAVVWPVPWCCMALKELERNSRRRAPLLNGWGPAALG